MLNLLHLPERTAKLRHALSLLTTDRRGQLAHVLNVEPYVIDDACAGLQAEEPTLAQVLGLAVVLGGLAASGRARGLRRALSTVLDTPEIVIEVGAEFLLERVAMTKAGLVPGSLRCPDCGFTPRQEVRDVA